MIPTTQHPNSVAAAKSVRETGIPKARAFVLTFGQHQGKPLDKIAESDAGLLYLDWMRGALRLDYHTRNAVCSYLDDATIAKDLAELVERKGRHR